jgi:hypothetical protein
VDADLSQYLRQQDNAAGVMTVDENLLCSFAVSYSSQPSGTSDADGNGSSRLVDLKTG